ncbi:MAG: hypothetical protein K8I27_03810 [Planctomycetes bacterium]|nr:hypothetical protein [Planctomycetota bacterium]
MKALTLIGVLLFVVGLTGVIWGLVVMYEDHDAIDIGDDIHIVVDDGDFPPIGIAGAITAGIGVLMIGVGSIGGRKSK